MFWIRSASHASKTYIRKLRSATLEADKNAKFNKFDEYKFD